MSGLAIVSIATAIAAVCNWYFRVRPNDLGELITKPLTTVGAIAIAALAGGPHSATIVAVIALVLCLIGDVALLPAVDQFVVGLASFLLGHIAFIVMFAPRLRRVADGRCRDHAGCATLVGTIGAPIVGGARRRVSEARARLPGRDLVDVRVGLGDRQLVDHARFSGLHHQRLHPRMGSVRRRASVDPRRSW
jgi:hypothetical protein